MTWFIVIERTGITQIRPVTGPVSTSIASANHSQIVQQVRHDNPWHNPHIHLSIDPFVKYPLLLIGILSSNDVFLHISLILYRILIVHCIRVTSLDECRENR